MICGQYEAVYMPEHPKASKSNGCVYKHILVAEEILGRYLTTEVVHHKDENKLNNNSSNIMIFQSLSDHTAFHHGREVFEVYPNVFSTNRTKNNFCLDCGTEITNDKKTLRCNSCAQKELNKDKTKRPSREILKDQIRNQSFLSLGKYYGVSDNAVRKWCKFYNLPFKTTEIKKMSDEEFNKL